MRPLSTTSFASETRSSHARARHVAFLVRGVSCRSCARRAELVLERVPGVLAATVRLLRERADVRFDARRTTEGAIAVALEHAGFAVASAHREPSWRGLAIRAAVAIAALAALLVLARSGALTWDAARASLAAIAIAVAGPPIVRRAIDRLRRGILDRDALAAAAATLCFAAGLVEVAVVRAPHVPGWLAALGARTADGTMNGAAFVAATAIVAAAIVARTVETLLLRLALRDLATREPKRAATARCLDREGRERPALRDELGPGDRVRIAEGERAPIDLHVDAPARIAEASPHGGLVSRALHPADVMPEGALLLSAAVTGRVAIARTDAGTALDAEVRAALGRLAETHGEPQPWSWEDAASRGILTATLGCASFALVIHGLLGRDPLGPATIFAVAAVLAGASPSSILAAAPAARAIALLRARAWGAVVKDPGALEALARTDVACFDNDLAIAPSDPCERAARDLRARRIRAVALRGERSDEKALAVRDLQLEGARVALVGGDDPAVKADVAIAVVPDAPPRAASAPIVIGGVDVLPDLVDLARSLRGVLRQNAALGAIYNAVLIPAAALGHITPSCAAALMLAEALAGLANAARLLYFPRGDEARRAPRRATP